MEGSDKGSDVGCLDGCFDGCLLSAEVISSSGHVFGSIVTPSPEHWLKAEDSVPGLFEGSKEGSDKGSDVGCRDGSRGGNILFWTLSWLDGNYISRTLARC